MSNSTCSFVNNKNIRCPHKVSFSITYCLKHKRCAKMNIIHSLLSLNKIQEKIKKVNEKNDLIQEMIKVAMQEVNQEKIKEEKLKEEKLKEEKLKEKKLKEEIRKNILEDIQQEVTKFDKEHDKEGVKEKIIELFKDVTQEDFLEATQVIEQDQEEETLEATQVIEQDQEETLDIIKINKCCFCNEECNPLSQACGRCARNRSMAW
jgi:hypothetical protein